MSLCKCGNNRFVLQTRGKNTAFQYNRLQRRYWQLLTSPTSITGVFVLTSYDRTKPWMEIDVYMVGKAVFTWLVKDSRYKMSRKIFFQSCSY